MSNPYTPILAARDSIPPINHSIVLSIFCQSTFVGVGTAKATHRRDALQAVAAIFRTSFVSVRNERYGVVETIEDSKKLLPLAAAKAERG